MKTLFLSAALLSLSTLRLAADVVLTDDFSYFDGALVTVSGSRWVNHSGTAGQVDVAGGRLWLTEAESEDVNAALSGQPYTAAGGTNLYARFTVNFTAAPAGSGNYFAHFKDASTGFRCRVFATTVDAAPGLYRLGIAAAGSAPSATLPIDLDPNTDYTVVCRLSTADSVSTLWLNPGAEADPGVTSADTGTPTSIVSFAFRQSLSSGNGIGALTVDDLVVATTFADLQSPAEGPPIITAHPTSQSVFEGRHATFTVVVRGAAPLLYQWRFDGNDLAGETNATLLLSNVRANQAGVYQVQVRNALGAAASDPATLTVLPPPAAVATNIAHLHTLLDPINYLPTDTNTLFQVEGVVTTHTNLTTSDSALFYLQDGTAGIAVFVQGGSTLRPAAGDQVRVTGPLGQFNGLLELNLSTADPDHEVVTLGTGYPLPDPVPLAFSWQTDPAVMEPLEGRFMVASDVFLDLSAGLTFTAGSNVLMTNQSGETFVLRIDSRVTDLIGQPKPHTPVTLYGVLGQFDQLDPRTAGYQLLPSRAADLVGPRLARVRFTSTLANLVRPGDLTVNTNFTEFALRPGESIRLEVTASDSLGRAVTVRPVLGGLPAGAVWVYDPQPSTEAVAQFTFTPASAQAGTNYLAGLQVLNADGTNEVTWQIYVPTPVEQRVILSEFLANPTADAGAPHYNPLHREVPSSPSKITFEDEFVELVNLSAETVALTDWSLADGVRVRHRFFAGDSLSSSNALVIYGGRTDGSDPILAPGVQAFAATEDNRVGLALNNDGDTLLLRNGRGHLIERVVYGSVSGKLGSLTRHPNLDGDFAFHPTVGTGAASPGTQNDGRLFSEPGPATPAAIRLGIGLTTAWAVRLQWEAESTRTYSVWRSDRVTGGFTSLASGLRFGTDRGEFIDPGAGDGTTGFYQVSSP
jgi:hypothetical protein